MDFDKFNYLITVADLRSISLAAKKCFISQPALTRCISKVEDDLGIKLFDRSSTPIALTYAGERYIAGIRNLCALKYELDKEMEDISQLKKGRITVGIPNTRSTTWLPQFLPIYQSKYPGIDLRLVESTSNGLEEMLLKEEIDLLLIGTLPIAHAGLEFEIIANEQIMFVFPSDYHLFKNKKLLAAPNVLHYIDPALLMGEPFISELPSQGLYRIANQIFNNLSIFPRTVLETGNVATALNLAQKGVGFTIAPVNCVLTERYEMPPVFCTLSDPPYERSIVIAYKKDRLVSFAARQLIDIVKHVAATCPALQIPHFDVVYDVCPPRS